MEEKLVLGAEHILGMSEEAVGVLLEKLEPYLENKVKVLMSELLDSMTALMEARIIAMPPGQNLQKLELEVSKEVVAVIRQTL